MLIGSVYVAILLRDLTDDFDALGTIRRAANFSRRGNVSSWRALVAIILIAIAVPFTLLMLAYFYFVNPDSSAQRVAAFINSATPPNALIESYDAELFFFLNRPYHYPPDQAHVDLIRRTLDPSVQVDYDPLAADPDYLVVGPFSAGWHVYDAVRRPDLFRPILAEGHYQIYERVRRIERTP
jgi:hypothetical protein